MNPCSWFSPTKPTSMFFLRCVLWINFAAPKSAMLAHLYMQTGNQIVKKDGTFSCLVPYFICIIILFL